MQNASRHDSGGVEEVYDSTLGQLSEGDVSFLRTSLTKKSQIITSSITGKEQLETPDYITLMKLCFPAKRYASAIVSQTDARALEEAFKSLRNSRTEPEDVVTRFRRLQGCPADVSWDLAAELIHFVNPDRYGLATRWVWNPERGTGALAPLLTETHERSFTRIQLALAELNAAIENMNRGFTGFYGLTVMCALTYAGNIIGAKDSAINSGGMEALFPDSGTLALMILGLGRLSYAHT